MAERTRQILARPAASQLKYGPACMLTYTTVTTFGASKLMLGSVHTIKVVSSFRRSDAYIETANFVRAASKARTCWYCKCQNLIV